MVEEEEKLQLLREILLLDDRQVADAITRRVETIQETIEKRDKLSQKVDPIIEARLSEFIKEIPETLGPVITKTLKEQVANSKDEIVEALFPILGLMIKKYVQHEMKMLSDSMNQKINNTFSFISFKRKVKSKFTGVKEAELILSETNDPKIVEVFLIQKGSGILLGNHSYENVLDKEMISGMLTAIKSFVEDVFSGGAQNLETIEYELYTLHIQNFHKYYMAIVVEGAYTNKFRDTLENKLLKLSHKIASKIATSSRESMDATLKTFFEKEN